MRIKTITCCIAVTLASLPLWGAAPISETANFNLTSPAGIPGYTLDPGAYTIHVVNHLKDRVILTLDSANGGVHATFIGVQDAKMEKPAKGGQVIWANPADGVSYVKGWYFPGDPAAIQFVYPKAAAVAIATANPNPAKVPAVDPASEGKVADNTLSQDDMQLLTLWVLSLQQVGPTPGIKAERYQLVASANPKPVVSSAIKALPHTASLVPLVWLLGLCSFAAAGLLRAIARHVLALHSRPGGAIAARSRRE